VLCRAPGSGAFPYTTLFRSRSADAEGLRYQAPRSLRGSIAGGMKRALIALALLAAAAVRSQAAAPIRYRLSFPEPQHRWMQVQATYTDLPSGALELRMSRSSPGRYSLHDFAKNVY